ncbi:PREDICTED: uncharacterized protein LOC104816690 [Tarenaya hassleriana]|uniref:uncharacterized protein LOC104816690 n=1 Tax=Tarenaya hassleriana TaxID=28532 RepID=UPI00053CA264|nr:PREDICTED: uncharacterized protein LOC104816690 [Tarenaya hassleriana]
MENKNKNETGSSSPNVPEAPDQRSRSVLLLQTQTQTQGQRLLQQTQTQGPAFQMPVHYPRYKREEYEKMSEEEIDRLLGMYGLTVSGDLDFKRGFAIGAFIWDDPKP